MRIVQSQSDVGDMDNYFLILAAYDLQALFDSATAPRAKADLYWGSI